MLSGYPLLRFSVADSENKLQTVSDGKNGFSQNVYFLKGRLKNNLKIINHDQTEAKKWTLNLAFEISAKQSADTVCSGYNVPN